MREVEQVLKDLEQRALGNERYVVEVTVYDCDERPEVIGVFRDNISTEWKYTDGLQVVKHICQAIEDNEATNAE
jgi:hypothetical protein